MPRRPTPHPARATQQGPVQPAAAGRAPALPDADSALFFDFDGTLVELAPRPEQVQVAPALPALLDRLRQGCGGALAVVSGRPVDQIDAHLPGLGLATAGVHGAERRGADGSWQRCGAAELDDAATLIEALCARFPALWLERKPGALALHYRQAPALEGVCRAAMLQAHERAAGTTLLHGKRVIELKPEGISKATALHAFLAEPPFRQRRPWFFGDDVTDEAGFEAVLALGGISVKIGDGPTLAAYRLPDPAALHDWLARAAARLVPAAGAGAGS